MISAFWYRYNQVGAEHGLLLAVPTPSVLAHLDTTRKLCRQKSHRQSLPGYYSRHARTHKHISIVKKRIKCRNQCLS